MKLTIFKNEFDFDVFDLDDKERLNAQHAILQEKAEEITDLSTAEGMRAYCGAVFAFFDAVLGEGSAKKLFGGKTNIITCIEAVQAFSEEISRSTAEVKSAIDALRVANRA